MPRPELHALLVAPRAVGHESVDRSGRVRSPASPWGTAWSYQGAARPSTPPAHRAAAARAENLPAIVQHDSRVHPPERAARETEEARERGLSNAWNTARSELLDPNQALSEVQQPGLEVGRRARIPRGSSEACGAQL
jgi:hypothetical protein